jgi:hypothetical protein
MEKCETYPRINAESRQTSLRFRSATIRSHGEVELPKASKERRRQVRDLWSGKSDHRSVQLGSALLGQCIA